MGYNSVSWLVLLVIAVFTIPNLCDNSTDTTTTVKPDTTTAKASGDTTTQAPHPDPPTTLSPEEECERLNSSCKECVGNSKCMYCYSNKQCMLYPAGKVLPPSSLCSLDDARWGTCLVNFKALIIALSVIGGVIILVITGCCIYCCCCRGKKGRKYEKEDARYESQRMERKAKQEERRSERRSRLDEIRMKYGLMKDDSAPYSRFDA